MAASGHSLTDTVVASRSSLHPCAAAATATRAPTATAAEMRGMRMGFPRKNNGSSVILTIRSSREPEFSQRGKSVGGPGACAADAASLSLAMPLEAGIKRGAAVGGRGDHLGLRRRVHHFAVRSLQSLRGQAWPAEGLDPQ